MHRLDLRGAVRPLARKVRGHDPYAQLDPVRLGLIDFAFQQLVGVRSFADLGGVWGVDGGYTFYALERYRPRRGVLVDTDVLPWVEARARRFPKLEVITGNFGDPAISARVGEVDTVMLFDTLLHQVAPDWDEVLELYAPRTRSFLIYNPQWTGERTVRLLELGEEEYFLNVPHAVDDPTPTGPDGEPLYAHLFGRLDEMNTKHGRLWRDVHNVWQWGITDHDLLSTMDRLGFAMKSEASFGPFKSLEHFERRAFVFERA
jgi:hypothetical protein